MNLVNHEPMIKCYGNGFQITFPNKYTLIVKNGLGAACTQKPASDDPAEMLLTYKLGGNSGPDVQVEIYSPSKQDISSTFGDLSFITPLELVNLLYICSALKP